MPTGLPLHFCFSFKAFSLIFAAFALDFARSLAFSPEDCYNERKLKQQIIMKTER